MVEQRARRDVAEALASALVLADLSDAGQAAAFSEEARAVGVWAEEAGDDTVAALAHEIRQVVAGVAEGTVDAAGAADLIGDMLVAMLEAPDAPHEPAPVIPASENVYAQDAAVVADFVSGAREQLDEAELLLSSCTIGESFDVDALFRCFHTLKGIAGFLSLDAMATVAHGVESALESVRSGSCELEESTVETALAAVDEIRRTVAEVERTAPTSGTAATSGAKRTAQKRANNAATTVRVDATKLDDLLDAMGELAVAEAEIAAAVRRSGDDAAIRSLERFQRIARDMQATATSLRMVDLQPTFRKMTRVVRDMIAHSDKRVEFVVTGGDTELDRQIVEGVSDPLVHLLRNAIDHGIEPLEARVAAGKPEQGRVELRAFHKAGNVHIEVCDDGRGINPEKLLAKAEALGMQVEPSEAMDLIFLPGFSTATSVTEISGRGVGMDAVATAVSALRGHLDVRSEPGVGTTFTIRLPLTLAVIDGIVLRAGAERYIVPTQFVDRTTSADGATIVSTAGRGEVLAMPGEHLAVVPITAPLGGELESGTVAVILDDGDQRFAILVDEVIGQQSLVIKPLSGPAAKANGVAGATLMGDGKAALVIDPSGIVRAMRGRW